MAMSKRAHFITFTLVFLITSSISFAQPIQKGYVKTKGRMDANGNIIAGTRLSEALIQAKDRQAVVSRPDGSFSFPIPAQSFYLEKVFKQGYVLTDPDVLERLFTFSSNPLVLVLEKPDDRVEDRLIAERNIRRTLQRQIQAKEDELDSLRAQNKLTEEAYRRALQELFSEQRSNESLIEDMVENYSRLDFDALDDFNQQISRLILEGNLSEAEKLLNEKGDITERTANYRKHKEANERESQTLNRRLKRLEKSRALERKEMEDLAQDCYSRYDIYRLRHQNDSAAFYIEWRASLDSTNLTWLSDAGSFLRDYTADYEKALHYYQTALNLIRTIYGENHSEYAAALYNRGRVYGMTDRFQDALKDYAQSLAIVKNLYGENDLETAKAYNQMGIAYCSLSDYPNAEECCLKAKEIVENIGEDPYLLAVIYNDLGAIYYETDKLNDALMYYLKALDIYNGLPDVEDHLYVSSTYNNLGTLYYNIGDYKKAQECLEKAMQIDSRLLSDNHPSIAKYLMNLAAIYRRQMDYPNALLAYDKALDIIQSVYGESGQLLIECYGGISSTYYNSGNLDNALNYQLKATELRKTLLDPGHPDIATAYNNLAAIYDVMGADSLVFDYYEKALEIRECYYGVNHSLVASTCANIGLAYTERKNYSKAFEYLGRALSIYEQFLDPSHPALIYTRTSYDAARYHQAISEGRIKEFLKDKVFTATVVSDNTPAGQLGLAGDYILLELNDWTMQSNTSLFEKNTSLQGSPKDLLLMKDSTISHYHFDDVVGVRYGIKQVGEEEKKAVDASYKKWKKHQK